MFAGCIAHLYYTENSSFAFHALLSSGYLFRVCQNINRCPKYTLRNLMLLMSHVFGRLPLRLSTLESHRRSREKLSYVVVLPPLSKKAFNVLHKHNKQILNIYTGYLSTSIDKHVKCRESRLPLSGLKIGGNKSAADLGLVRPDTRLPVTKITSEFCALSGQGDKWDSVSDLCAVTRDEVWLEESVVPYMPITPHKLPLNAYLYDFFKHGNVQQLEKANKIRRADI